MTALGRPTAVVRRVDVSAPHERSSAAPSAFSEPELVAGYGGLTGSLETRACVCGGEVTADPKRPAPGVAAHQFTSRHKAWREAQDVE